MRLRCSWTKKERTEVQWLHAGQRQPRQQPLRVAFQPLWRHVAPCCERATEEQDTSEKTATRRRGSSRRRERGARSERHVARLTGCTACIHRYISDYLLYFARLASRTASEFTAGLCCEASSRRVHHGHLSGVLMASPLGWHRGFSRAAHDVLRGSDVKHILWSGHVSLHSSAALRRHSS
jgi:hypothetical protein